MWKEYWMRKERLILAHTPHLAQHSPWGGYTRREWSFFETFDGGNWRAPLLLDPCWKQDCFLEKDITSSKGPSIDQLCFCVMAWQNNCRLATPVGSSLYFDQITKLRVAWEWQRSEWLRHFKKQLQFFLKLNKDDPCLQVLTCSAVYSTTTFTWQST